MVSEADKHIIISLTGAKLSWASANITSGAELFATNKEAFRDWASETHNTFTIQKTECNTASYAPGFCQTYSALNTNNKGFAAGSWRLPSIAELYLIYKHIDKINFMLSMIDGAEIINKTIHLSSTELNTHYIWGLHFYDGVISTMSKTETTYNIRAITSY